MILRSRNLIRWSIATSHRQRHGQFDWQDPLQWKSLLKPEELFLYNTAKDFSKDYLLPKIVDATRKERFDREIMAEYGRMGFLGCTLKGFGFAEIGEVGYGLICNAVESVDSSYRSALLQIAKTKMRVLNEKRK